MSKVRLYGDTSGFVDLKAPDVASNVTITLPNTTGPFATETYVDSEIAAIPEIAGIGSNVVTGTTSTRVSSNTTTFVDTNLSATITPTSATSKIFVFVTQHMEWNTNSTGLILCDLQIVRDSTVVALYPDVVSKHRGDVSIRTNVPIFYVDSPNTTSPVTYKTQFNASTGGAKVNGGYYSASRSEIVLIEVSN